MDWIERYLQAVRFALPEAQRDDITRELRDNILSQVEEREAALGRPLNEDELLDLLKKLGSPLELASRYRRQQYLIGAAMFPVYWKVLKLTLGIALVVLAASSVALAAAGKPFSTSLGVLFSYPGLALTIFAWITLIFAALEFFGRRLELSHFWDPRRLPPLMKAERRASQFELIARLVTQALFGAWWLAGLRYQYLVLGPAAAFLRFSPVWRTLYPLFVALVLVDVGLTSCMLFAQRSDMWEGAGRVLKSALSLASMFVLVRAPELFVAAADATDQFRPVVKSVNYGLHLGLFVALIVTIVKLAYEAARWMGRKLERTHQSTAAL